MSDDVDEVPSTTGLFVRVRCRRCGYPMSAKSLPMLGAHIVDHENAVHHTGVTITSEGDIAVKQ